MQQNQPAQKDWLGDTKQGFDLLLSVLNVLAFPVHVLTTKLGTWGNRCHGTSAAMGFFWPLLAFVGAARFPGSGFLLLFWIALVVHLARHETRRRKYEREGVRCHSRYWGRSWFESPDADLNVQESARAKACLLILGLGMLCLAIMGPLGVILILGAIAKMVTDAVAFSATRARLRQMEDSRIDTEYFADLYRQKNRMN